MANIDPSTVQIGPHENVPENLYNELEMRNIVTESAEFVLDIRRILDDLETSASSERCIYRAPENVRRSKEAAYTPYVVSIGPYHHGNQRLWSMEGFKRSYCKKLIEKSGQSLEIFIRLLKEYEERARDCFEESIRLSSNEFLAIILVDGCFIIEFLLRSHYTELREPGDNIPSMQLLRIHIKHDLVLLENQLPYFILESLFTLIDPSSSSPWKERPPKLQDLVMSFFETYNKHGMLPDFRSVKHFTDLIRTLHEPKRKTWDSKYPDSKFVASATHLNEAGVKFKMVSGKCLLDIEFNNGVLELPCFELNDDRESLFRNLMVLELRHYPNDTFIIDYFVFMDTLINTAYDVNLLVQNGVLLNRYGDYWDAANSFNNFRAGITHYDATSYLIPIYGKLNAYYKKPRHTWMTTFKRDYFSTPFKTASTITAVSLLVLTFIATVCSVISVV